MSEGGGVVLGRACGLTCRGGVCSRCLRVLSEGGCVDFGFIFGGIGVVRDSRNGSFSDGDGVLCNGLRAVSECDASVARSACACFGAFLSAFSTDGDGTLSGSFRGLAERRSIVACCAGCLTDCGRAFLGGLRVLTGCRGAVAGCLRGLSRCRGTEACCTGGLTCRGCALFRRPCILSRCRGVGLGRARCLTRCGCALAGRLRVFTQRGGVLLVGERVSTDGGCILRGGLRVLSYGGGVGLGRAGGLTCCG